MAKIETENTPVNTIATGSVIKGNVSLKGDCRLDGTIQGDVSLTGKLVVGEGGVVTGNITCQNANIIGTVTGNISSTELLSLHATAKVRGDIIVNRLSIEPGASFSGNCRLLEDVKRSQQQSDTSKNS